MLSVVRVGCCRAAAFTLAEMEIEKVRSTCGRRQDAKATTREPSVPFARMGEWESEKSVSNKKGRRVGCIVSIYGAWVTGLLGL